jgi:hypothetical protein
MAVSKPVPVGIKMALFDAGKAPKPVGINNSLIRVS